VKGEVMRATLLVLAATAAACAPAAREEAVQRNDSTPPTAAAARPSAYVVRGAPRPHNGPWFAVIREGRLLLDSPTSAGWYSARLPAARFDGGRRIFAAEMMNLAIEPGACALRELYPALADRVTLEWDAGRFEGCGGAHSAPSGMAGTVWELVRIGDDPAPAGRSPAVTLIFGRDGGLGGTLSCNDGGLRTMWTGGGGFVAVGSGFEQTAMGCNDPAGEAFGMRFWGGLESARAWRRERERLFITFADGTEAELRFLL
jgi:heat shock protein HslJ